MKRLITSLTLITSLLVVGCSTNSQSDNTVLGALGGAAVGGGIAGLAGGSGLAIGASIVGGALLGGYIGHSMENSDNNSGSEAIASNSTDETKSWVNRHTGTAYTMTPTSERFAVKGNSNCRKFHFTATTKSGKTESYNGTACMMKDGKWHAI